MLKVIIFYTRNLVSGLQKERCFQFSVMLKPFCTIWTYAAVFKQEIFSFLCNLHIFVAVISKTQLQ